MVLYVSLTIWMFLLLLIGLRKDAQTVVDLWPAKPDDVIVSRNLRVCTVLAVLTLFTHIMLASSEPTSMGSLRHVAIMLMVHRCGKGLVGVYSYDVAVSKVQRATKMARDEGFPLRLTYTPE